MTGAQYGSHNGWFAAANRIRQGLGAAPSIDNLLHTHQNDEQMVRIGKMAIAHKILEAEAGSKLAPYPNGADQRFNLWACADSWYHAFAKLLVTGITKKEVSKIFENVSIICFQL